MCKKDLIQLGVTGVLVIVLIFALGNAFKKKPGAPPSKVKNVLPKAMDSAAVSANQVNRGLYHLLEQQADSLELKRDPFTAAPITSEKVLSGELDLTGILWDKDKPLVIINGNIIKKGERLGSKTIVEIKRDRVVLSDGAALYEIKLNK